MKERAECARADQAASQRHHIVSGHQERARRVGIMNGMSVYMHIYIYMSQHIGSGHHLELEFREAIGQQRKAWTWQSGCWPRGHIGAVEPSGEPEHNELASLQRRGRDSPDLDPIIGT